VCLHPKTVVFWGDIYPGIGTLTVLDDGVTGDGKGLGLSRYRGDMSTMVMAIFRRRQVSEDGKLSYVSTASTILNPWHNTAATYY